ncbi:MAG: transposase, partial [Terriglobales bacterium]
HLHRVVEALDVSEFERAYGAEGRLAYPPKMMLKVWLYAFALNVSSTRRLEQRVREDLAFRYLAGGLAPDHKTLSEFLRRHRRALNDVFTQVLEQARRAGMVKLGHVAIDSTRVRASASRYRMDSEEKLRQERARYRRLARKFQQKAGAPDPDEAGGMAISAEQQRKLEQRMAEMPQRLQRLRKSGLKQVSRTDGDARFLRSREGWVLGYTPEVAVSDDHFIVAARVTQNASDNASLAPMVEEVERHCRCRPQKVTADSGYFSGAALHAMRRLGIEGYVPDNNLAHEMSTGERAAGIGKSPIRDPEHQRMREKLRSGPGRNLYRRRQAVVEPVIGILKEQRGMRRFRRRGLQAVATEWMLAAIAYNITRMLRR